eukprot:4835829-Ditylum_brightwellii.AAC.2
MILGMMENQNHFLEKQTSVAVQGFCDIETMVEDPDASPADKTDTSMEGLEPVKVMLIVWILRKQATDGLKLITSIEKGPRGNIPFACNSVMRCIVTQQREKQLLEKIKKKELRNAGESAQAFTQFLSSSVATGKKYADVENCWKRKPKLDYLDLDEEKKKTPKRREFSSPIKASSRKHSWYELSNEEEENEENVYEDDSVEGNPQQKGIKEDVQHIYKLMKRVDEVEKNLEETLEGKSSREIAGQQDLLKTIMECTARFEATMSNTPTPEVTALEKETKKLEQQQNDLLEWKMNFSKKVERKIDKLATHGKRMDSQHKTTNKNIEQLMISIAQIGQRCKESTTMSQVTNLMTSQNLMNSDIAQLRA